MKSVFILALGFSFFTQGARAETKPALRAEDGGLAHDVIDTAIRQKMPEVQQCYADELSRKPALGEGKVRVKFVIAADGKVKSIDAVSSFSSQHLESCLERELRSLSFPRPIGGGTVEVSYPFHFSPTEIPRARSKR